MRINIRDKMTLQTQLSQFARENIYSTPHRLSSAVFLAVHASLASSQAIVGNNYFETRANQFREHPLATTFEIMVPYIVTYISNSVGRRLR
jgi:hypothetical protein